MNQMISLVVSSISKFLLENEKIETFFKGFTEASVDWIKPLFLEEDGSDTKLTETLKADPRSNTRKEKAKAEIGILIEDNPEYLDLLKSLYSSCIESKADNSSTGIVLDSKNVNTGNVNTGGGNFRIGDDKKI